MVWLALVAFAAGYGVRCYRPLARIDTWAWGQVDRRARDLHDGRGRRRPGWYTAQVVFAAEIAVAFVAQPRETAARIQETRERHRQPRSAG